MVHRGRALRSASRPNFFVVNCHGAGENHPHLTSGGFAMYALFSSGFRLAPAALLVAALGSVVLFARSQDQPNQANLPKEYAWIPAEARFLRLTRPADEWNS